MITVLEVFTVPAAFGTTTCEYSVGCQRQTNLVGYFGTTLGHLPVCKVHIHFYNNN